ncbi:serine/threonine-protein kinase [Azospirillum agricola]|uniref:serine/threonine-protein kinase n=1 Tax=Azospirillum agricola TaxID=1720247 RepID=UPI000A0F1444|nr:serine/threonine-protein kinase [Azospirillum agricola]SMH62700.1 AAA ATPase domain-containing protein [Azospirillum lipoferum]
MTLPHSFGGYRVTGVLGQGAMGVVYAGHHDRDGTPVAIKTVDGLDAARFGQIRREIRALARLDHPGVIRILDSGVENGQPWYAMERLSGPTFRSLVNADRSVVTRDPSASSADSPTAITMIGTAYGQAESPQADPSAGTAGQGLRDGELAKALAIMQRVCDSLAFVHGEGIVHRDLKPDNILIRENGLPLLADFGLVEDARGAVGREHISSPQHSISGSPAYMSPEQGRGEILDARSDLYSVGCILYQLVTGRTPFSGAYRSVIKSHLSHVVVPPAAIAADVSPALNGLIVGLLAKEPNERVGYAEIVAGTLGDLALPALAWTSALPAAKPYLYRSGFVGRQDLLASLDAEIRRGAAGEGRLVLIAGESGAGKTRLAMEAGLLARRAGLEVVSGSCSPTVAEGEEGRYAQGAPLHVFRPLMDLLADRCVEGGADLQARLLGDHGPVLADYFPSIRALPGMAQRTAPLLPSLAARQRLFTAFARTLSAYCQDRPVMLVLDDLQWADDLTLGFIRHLNDGLLPAMPLLLLGTFRSEERTQPLDELFAAPHTVGCTLFRMSAAEVREMVGGMLAMSSLPGTFIGFLTERSNGNPFFIAEYLRSAIAERVLRRDAAGRWSLPAQSLLDRTAFEALPLPVSLHQLIELRLTRLSAPLRRVVDAAALMGRVLDLKVLRRVEAQSETGMLDIVDALVRHQIVEADGNENFHFVHDKIHEIAELQLDGEARGGLHRRIAEVLEVTYPDGPEREAQRAALGRHWAAGGVPERAVPHLRHAAEAAQRLHALEDAIRLFAAALRELRRLPDPAGGEWREAEIALNEGLGDCQALKNAHQQARDAFDAARAALSGGDGDPLTQARLWRKTGKTWEIEHDHQQALAAYDQAVGSLPSVEGDEVPLAWKHEWIQIKLNRVWVFYWLVWVAEINAELEAVRPLLEQVGTPAHRYHYFMSVVLRNHRQFRFRVSDDTLDNGWRMRDAAIESGNLADIGFARFTLGFTLLFAGKLEAAESELFEAVQGCRRIGEAAGETRALAYLAMVHRRQGRADETRTIATSLVGVAAARKMDDYRGLAHACLGWCAAKDGDVARAREENQRALDIWKALPFTYPFQWSAALTELALLRGDAGNPQVAALAGLMFNPPQLHLPDPIHLGLGRIVAGGEAGDAAELAAGLEQALSAAEELGYI